MHLKWSLVPVWSTETALLDIRSGFCIPITVLQVHVSNAIYITKPMPAVSVDIKYPMPVSVSPYFIIDRPNRVNQINIG